MAHIAGIMTLILFLIASVYVMKWLKRERPAEEPDPDIIDRAYYDSLR